MESNAEKIKLKPKRQCKTNKKNVRSYGGGGTNGANGSTSDFQGHTSSPGTWPMPFMSYQGPPAPMTLIQPPLIISHNVYNPHVPVFQPQFGIPMTPQPVPVAMPILQPITSIFNQPRPGLYFNDCSAPPMRSKPRFAPIIPPSARKINSKMHSERRERDTPHAIAIMDPENRKDIRKEYIESKCSSLREASEVATESTAQADSLAGVTMFPIEEDVSIQDLQFLQDSEDSIISNEEYCITQGELQRIVQEEQVSVFEEPFDQIGKKSEGDDK